MRIMNFCGFLFRSPILICICVCFSAQHVWGQNRHVADSVRRELSQENLDANEYRDLYRELLRNEINKDTIIRYAKEYLALSKELSEKKDIHNACIYLGSSYRDKGNLELALEFFFEALNNATKDSDRGVSFSNIANVYENNQDFEKAIVNQKKAKEIFIEIGDSLRIGTASISIGYGYYMVGLFDSAAYYCNLSKSIFETIEYQYRDYYWAYAEGNLALVKASLDQDKESEESLINAIEILSRYQDHFAICDYEFQLAKIYFARGNIDPAIKKAIYALGLAKENGFNAFIRDGSEVLSDFYAHTGDYEKAYAYQSQFIVFRDSLVNADLIRKLADQQKEYEVGQKQAEVNVIAAQQKTERVILVAFAVLAIVLIVLALIIFKYYRSKTQINQILEQQKLQLEVLNSTKDKFFSIISHDLRGPVSSFFGISRMIKYLVKSQETDQLLEIADDIDSSVERLSNLLDNLLSWAMQQQGQFPNLPEKLQLKEMTDELVGTLNTMAGAKKITLSNSIDDEIELWVDKNTTMTILRNLVNNALKFTPEEGSVSLSAKAVGQFAEIRVEDTGVGIPKEKLTKLFGLEAKKSTYGTSGEKGLGLGLQLVYEFIEMNKGSIAVESEEGRGTTFIIRLPLFQTENVIVAS